MRIYSRPAKSLLRRARNRGWFVIFMIVATLWASRGFRLSNQALDDVERDAKKMFDVRYVRHSLNKKRGANGAESLARIAIRKKEDNDVELGMRSAGRNYRNDTKLLEQDVQRIVQKHPGCQGKEELVSILVQGGSAITDHRCQGLPLWKTVTELYGERPFVYGLDTCESYRKSLSPAINNGSQIRPMPRVAGLYHSNTNLMTSSFAQVFGKLNSTFQRHDPYDVAWGKHLAPEKYRLMNTAPPDNPDSKNHTFPIVIIRDPFRWMRSMCREGYDASFIRGRCPTFVVSTQHGVMRANKVEIRPEQAQYEHVDVYESLPHFWSEWYNEYFFAPYPRLIVRFEDLLFRAPELLQIISDCIGLPMTGPFRYRTKDARYWSRKSSLYNSLEKQGTPESMYMNMSMGDKEYVQMALDPKLMKMFGYTSHYTLENETEPYSYKRSVNRTRELWQGETFNGSVSSVTGGGREALFDHLKQLHLQRYGQHNSPTGSRTG